MLQSIFGIAPASKTILAIILGLACFASACKKEDDTDFIPVDINRPENYNLVRWQVIQIDSLYNLNTGVYEVYERNYVYGFVRDTNIIYSMLEGSLNVDTLTYTYIGNNTVDVTQYYGTTPITENFSIYSETDSTKYWSIVRAPTTPNPQYSDYYFTKY